MITLKALREAAGLSQLEVAYKARVSSSRLSLFENSLGSLTVEEQQAVRKGIVAMAKERAKRTVSESSRVVQLQENWQARSRATSKKYAEQGAAAPPSKSRIRVKKKSAGPKQNHSAGFLYHYHSAALIPYAVRNEPL